MSFNNPKSISSSIHHLKILTSHDNLSKQKHDMGFFRNKVFSFFEHLCYVYCYLLIKTTLADLKIYLF